MGIFGKTLETQNTTKAHALEQRFSTLFWSHGTHQLITKILRHAKKNVLPIGRKYRYHFDSFTPTAVVVLAVAVFAFDSLRETRSAPLTNESGIAYFKHSCGSPVEKSLS